MSLSLIISIVVLLNVALAQDTQINDFLNNRNSDNLEPTNFPLTILHGFDSRMSNLLMLDLGARQQLMIIDNYDVLVYNLPSGSLHASFQISQTPTCGTVLSSGLVAIADERKSGIHILSIESEQVVRSFAATTKYVSKLKQLPSGVLVSAYEFNMLSTWNLEDYSLIRSSKVGFVDDLVLLDNGASVGIVKSSGFLVYEPETGSYREAFVLAETVQSVAQLDNGDFLVRSLRSEAKEIEFGELYTQIFSIINSKGERTILVQSPKSADFPPEYFFSLLSDQQFLAYSKWSSNVYFSDRNGAVTKKIVVPTNAGVTSQSLVINDKYLIARIERLFTRIAIWTLN